MRFTLTKRSVGNYTPLSHPQTQHQQDRENMEQLISAGWTAQTESALQRGVDFDAHCAGQIGGDDDAVSDRGVGALAGGGGFAGERGADPVANTRPRHQALSLTI